VERDAVERSARELELQMATPSGEATPSVELVEGVGGRESEVVG
jgi:hypothetical protein